ncbi:hypothetical protein EPN28_02165 [Patescibacteria group bacterium]|nr:MAG: hypothetical protein EPN28_02165 [Patescibacteria group bacterium]
MSRKIFLTIFLAALLFSFASADFTLAADYCRVKLDVTAVSKTTLACYDISALSNYPKFKGKEAGDICNEFYGDLENQEPTVKNYTAHECVSAESLEECKKGNEAPACPKTKLEVITKLTAELRPPATAIRIPGLSFSEINKNITEDAAGNKYLNIPWIGEMLTAVYKFAITIVSIVAVIMIIIQGARVVTSGGGEAKMDAYKKIIQAIIGLAIAWGSYAILYNINPDLVTFKALKVRYIQPIPMPEFADDLQTTKNDTTSDSSGYSSVFANCPITLSAPFSPSGNPANEARTKEFYDKINSVIKGTTLSDKILQIAEAASKCQIHFGSCGRTIGTVYTLAGITTKSYGSDCLTKPKGCWTHEQSKQLNTISSSLIKSFPNYRCGRDCKGNKDSPSGCANSDKEARKKMLSTLLSDSNLTSKGWPDTWANDLKPGDTFWVYNGNTSCSGLHTALFLGWASDGVAKVIQGAAGKAVGMGSICIKKSCGERMNPLIKTFRPQ